MKHTVKYRVLNIVSKLYMEVRIIVDDKNSEYNSIYEGNKFTSLNINPLVGLTITRAIETDENGNRIKAPWNPNDNLVMTKYNLPILYEELYGIQQDMKKPELYTYHGKRLELNESLAENIRRVFVIGNTTVELSAVVIVQPDESRVEGIKMKFNNEQSSVLLTINELTSLVFNIGKLDVDSIALCMYNGFVNKDNKGINNTINNSNDFPLPNVDILPKI